MMGDLDQAESLLFTRDEPVLKALDLNSLLAIFEQLEQGSAAFLG